MGSEVGSWCWKPSPSAAGMNRLQGMWSVRREVGRQVVKQEHKIGVVSKAKRNKHNRSEGRNFRGM